MRARSPHLACRGSRRALPRVLLSVALPAMAAALASCGGGGGAGAAIAPSPSRVTDLEVTVPAEGPAQIDVAVAVPPGRSAEIEVEFSEDLGARFQPARLGAPAAPLESGDGSPARRTLLWDYEQDLSERPQGDIVLRVTPRDTFTGEAGEAAVSGVLEIGASTAPRATSVEPPGAVAGARVPIAFTVADEESDYVTLDVQYRAGAQWRPASPADPPAGPYATSPEGRAYTFVWDAEADLEARITRGVQVRIAAADARPGAPRISAAFDVNRIAPRIEHLTLNAIPVSMCGSTPLPGPGDTTRPFHLAVPPHGFTIDIRFGRQIGGTAVDAGSLRVTLDIPLGGGAASGGVDAGADLGGRFVLESREAHWTVPEVLALPVGTATARASIADTLGNRSETASLAFEVVEATPALRPFEALDHWVLDFGRDHFSISSTVESDRVRVDAVYTPDGVPDFLEDLEVLGLRSSRERPDAAGSGDRVTAWIKDEIRTVLGQFYGEVDEDGEILPTARIRFHLYPPTDPYSRIAIGGDDVVPGYTIGRAYFDPRNAGRENDTAPDLGIFTTNVIQFYVNSSYSFRRSFDPLIPGRGLPVGESPLDARVLSSDFDRLAPENSLDENRRFDRVMGAAEAIARTVATILAHEIGHSLGLVANGLPPGGLFGGETGAPFAGPYTNTYHLDTPGNNIMAAAIGFSGATATGAGAPHFNELNWAYLLERILVR